MAFPVRAVRAFGVLVVCLALWSALLLPDALRAERYHYDDAGRLVLVIYDDLSSITYRYDDNGNLLDVSVTDSGTAGDVDLDGHVDDADVAAIVAMVLDGESYSPTADCNGDDRVSAADIACAVIAKGAP